jgi:RNA-directed DNA polymerase
MEPQRRFKARVRQLTRRSWSISLEERVRRLTTYLTGWRAYFGFCETPSVLCDLDSWIRHRLGCAQWKQWKAFSRRKAELIRLGVAPALAVSTAWGAKGPWRISHTPGVRIALDNGYFDALGLPRLDLREHLALLNRRRTDPYARWCRRGGAVRRSPMRMPLRRNRA